MMLQRSRPVLLACLAVAGAAGFAFTLLLMTDDPPGRPGIVAEELASDTDVTPSGIQDEPPTTEQILLRELTRAETEKERVEALDKYGAAADATSGSRVLRARMIADNSPEVRLKAFQVAKELAIGEGRAAVISILETGVGNPYPEVRRESIRVCRDNPNYELMDDLIEIVKRGGSDRSVAIQALAFMDDPEAQRKVLETAQSTELPSADRIAAIALLSRTDLDEGVTYLQELATGDDLELKLFAMEALKAWQDRKANK